MLEDKLAQRRKRRMEELEQKQMHETKVTNFLNCSQISCLREPETQVFMVLSSPENRHKSEWENQVRKNCFFFCACYFCVPRGVNSNVFTHIRSLSSWIPFLKKINPLLARKWDRCSYSRGHWLKMKKPLGFGRLYFICSTPLLGSGLQRQNLSGRWRYRDDQETRARENGGDEGGWVANRWWNGSGRDTLCRCWHRFKYEQFAIRYFCLLKILTN